MSVIVARVAKKRKSDDFLGEKTIGEILKLDEKLGSTILNVRTAKVFKFEGLTLEEVKELMEKIVEFDEYSAEDQDNLGIDSSRTIEVGYKPGVMNPEAASVGRIVRELGFSHLKAVDTSIEYYFISGFLKPTDEQVEFVINRLLVNKTTQMIIKEKPKTLVVSV